jgi:hypothetical protein
MKQLISRLDLGDKLTSLKIRLVNFLNFEEKLSSEWFEFLRHLLFNDVESTYKTFLDFLETHPTFSFCIYKHNFRPVYQVYKYYGFEKSAVIDAYLSNKSHPLDRF